MKIHMTNKILGMNNRIHVIPRDDLKSHTSSGINCSCKPRIVDDEHSGSEMVIHNAWDGREFYEFGDGEMLIPCADQIREGH